MTQDTKTVLNLARRETLGKKVRAMRRAGVIPANIYGSGVESLAVQVTSDDLRHLMRGHGRNEIVYVQVDGEERPTFVRDVQRNPVTDQILHVDFLQVSLKNKVRLSVPIHLVGLSPAVDTFGGVLTHATTEIMVEALPTAIPQNIVVDVTVLTELGQSLHVSDIPAPEGVEIVSDPEAVIARIDIPAAERAEEMGAEAAEGAEAPEEGAAPAPEAEAGGEEAGE